MGKMYSKLSGYLSSIFKKKRKRTYHNELELENIELRKQIDVLKSLNRRLEIKSKPVPKTRNHEIKDPQMEQKISISNLSEQKIDEFVEKILDDKDINIGYLPDFVERKIYKNVFSILVNLLDEIVDTTSVGLLGHQIKLDMKSN